MGISLVFALLTSVLIKLDIHYTNDCKIRCLNWASHEDYSVICNPNLLAL